MSSAGRSQATGPSQGRGMFSRAEMVVDERVSILEEKNKFGIGN